MIINKDVYECPQCRNRFYFDTSKEYHAYCPECKCSLEFLDNADCDTEQAERLKNAPKYDPTLDPDSPYYIPVITCPYCSSSDTSKISILSRTLSVGFFGIGGKKIGKQWHCNKCGSDF